MRYWLRSRHVGSRTFQDRIRELEPGLRDRISAVHASYHEIPYLIRTGQIAIQEFDFILLDLGYPAISLRMTDADFHSRPAVSSTSASIPAVEFRLGSSSNKQRKRR